MRSISLILFLGAALSLGGCKDAGPVPPAPGADGGDAGLPDASMETDGGDAGLPDAGVATDGGDAGLPDAGLPDAGVTAADGGTRNATCELVPANGWGPEGTVAIRVEVVARNLEVPWGLAWLPGGDLLITERPGRVRRLRADGTLEPAPIATVPALRDAEAGLLGLAVAPDFVSSRAFFLYLTTDTGGRTRNRVERWVLPDDGSPARLERIIIDDIPATSVHDGGRLRFGPDGHLYVTTGDARDPERARDLSSIAGKVLRVTMEGAAPGDNPQPGNPVYVAGMRNPQGLDWLADGTLVVTDHGPSGDLGRRAHDEVNLAHAGDDLGWPEQDACNAVEGTVLPLLSFETAAPPGGIALYTGTSIPEWTGSLLMATLGSRHLQRLELANGELARHEVYLQDDYGRLREAIMGPDGHLYLTTSNCDGRGSCGADKDLILRVLR